MTIKEQIEALIIKDTKLHIKRLGPIDKEATKKVINGYRDLNFSSGHYDYLFEKLIKKL